MPLTNPHNSSIKLRPRGFTLIEMLVSVAIFATVMIIALGALLAMSESDRRAESIKAVVNNLNFGLDSMSRAIRTGTTYHCGTTGALTSPQDCSTGGTQFAFINSNGVEVIYNFSQSAALCGNAGCIVRSLDSGASWQAVTAPEVVITNMQFYLVGSTPGDTLQPKLTIEINGFVQQTGSKKTSFNLQTSVTQRIYDQ